MAGRSRGPKAGHLPEPPEISGMLSEPTSGFGTKILRAGSPLIPIKERPPWRARKTCQELFHDTLKDIYFAEKRS